MMLKLPNSMRWQQILGLFAAVCFATGMPCNADQPMFQETTVYPVNEISSAFTGIVWQDEEAIVIEDSPAPQEDAAPAADETVMEPPAPDSGEVVGDIQPAVEQEMGAGTPTDGQMITYPPGQIYQPDGSWIMSGDGCGCPPTMPMYGMPMGAMPMAPMMPMDSGMVSMPSNNCVTPDCGIDCAPAAECCQPPARGCGRSGKPRGGCLQNLFQGRRGGGCRSCGGCK